jgi:hypothetical protein
VGNGLTDCQRWPSDEADRGRFAFKPPGLDAFWLVIHLRFPHQAIAGMKHEQALESLICLGNRTPRSDRFGSFGYGGEARHPYLNRN